ncbi:MAG: hypothetical protein HYZ50_01365 [Deltaproteobacteria bacterium]|nr:hypothetical protein [Deltaproteobacteria bacterium]
MPLPLILAVAGALAGGAWGAYGGVKLGSWLKSPLGDEEQKAVAAACAKLGIKSSEDVKKLPAEKQRQFAKALDSSKNKTA